MAVVLFVVAFAMVVAGLAAIYDGYAIVMIEKGWTKVIAGAVGGSVGFLLFGIVAVLAYLKRIAAGLESLRAPVGDFEAPARQPPQSAEALAAGIDAALAAPDPGRGGAPEPPVSARPTEPPPRAAQDAAAAPEPPPVQAPDAAAAPEPVRAPERRAAPPDEAPPAPKQAAIKPPTVVGTYSSGGNTYVMYSDGSIQAQTPTGLFRFDTLDELKAFIAAGGESGPPAR